MLKRGNWHVGHVAIMLSFMLYLNIGLNLYIKVQNSRLNWWCHLYIGGYYCIRSTMLSYLLILGTKRCTIYCLLVFSGHKCENHVREFVGRVRVVNMPKTAHKHPQIYWNPYLLLIKGLNHGQWTLSLG